MATCPMSGKLAPAEVMKPVSAERTDDAIALKKYGGESKAEVDSPLQP